MTLSKNTSVQDDTIVDLIVPEDELLTFQLPSTLDAVRSAYGHSHQATSSNEKELIEDPIEHIERLFPKQTKKNPIKEALDNDPGFSIDQDKDPLII